MGLEQQLHSLIQKIWISKQLPHEDSVSCKLSNRRDVTGVWPAFYEPIDEDAVFLARYAGFVSEHVPEDPEATRFILKFARECCLTRTSLINAFIYFSKTRLHLNYTWRVIFVNCILIAERMWEDNYIHPAFIRQRYTSQPCASKFTSLQLEILAVMDWRVNTDESEFNTTVEAILSRSEGPQSAAKLPQRPLPALPKIQFDGYRRRSTASTTASMSSFLNHAT